MNVPKPTLGRALAEAADKADELAKFRNEFVFGEENVIYLDGNSLGRLTKKGRAQILKTADQEWGSGLIRSWGESWLSLPRTVGDKIAKLIGAKESEVLVSDSTSVNLFKLATAALKLRSRKVILTVADNFPSDLYILKGVGDLQIMPNIEALLDNLNEETAIVSLAHTCYKTGRIHDMRLITEAAHKAGAFVIWDISHSVGVIPLQLDNCFVDMAVGCTYKYLNGGPGSPAFLFVREEMIAHMENPIQGWFSHADPFQFKQEFEAAAGIERFLTGTPPILSMAALEPALDLILEAGIDRLRKKSFLLTEYVIALAHERLTKYGVEVVSPAEAGQRGSHVSFMHADAWQLSQALIEHGVVPDFREPNILRIGLAPIYTSFVEVYDAITMLENILANKLHSNYSVARSGVS